MTSDIQQLPHSRFKTGRNSHNRAPGAEHLEILGTLADELNEMNESMDGVRSAAALMRAARERLEKAQAEIAAQKRYILSLEENALVDTRTGLKNKAGLMRAYEQEKSRMERGHSSGGVIVVIEFDNYNKVKEEHGTAACETGSKLIAYILESEIRGMDIAARQSDDEFALLLPETTIEEATLRIQALNLRLNKLSLILHGQEISINASLSMQAYSPEDQNAPQETSGI